MVSELQKTAMLYRSWLNDGLDIKEQKQQDGSINPPLKATGEEIREALGENLAIVQNVIAYILDGKSNKVAPKAKR